MRRALILLALLYFVGPSKAFAAERCAGLFAFDIDSSLQALAELRISIDRAQAGGRQSIEFTALNADYVKKEKELLHVLTVNKIMTRDELVIRIKNEIKKIQGQKKFEEPKEERIKKETRKIEQTIVNGAYVIMNRVPPGTFAMGKEKVPVEITKPFDLMATLTTQHIWKQIIDLAMAAKIDNELGKLPNDPSSNGPLLPMDYVSRNNLHEWLGALNQLSHLPEMQASLREIIPDHKQGDVYRLPTEAEWEYVGSRFVKSDLSPYGWFSDNAPSEIQPVATKDPMTAFDQKFYDYYGNVNQWVADGFSTSLPGGQDPFTDPTTVDMGVLRGASIYLSSKLSVFNRINYSPGQQASTVGFRLAREVRP